MIAVDPVETTAAPRGWNRPELSEVSPRPTDGRTGDQGRPHRAFATTLDPGSSLRSVRGDTGNAFEAHSGASENGSRRRGGFEPVQTG